MNFEALKRRVQRAEQLAERRSAQAQAQRAQLKQSWREAWTPGRIVVIGLVGGFLFSRARPLRTLGAVSTTRWVQLATSVSGLFASLKAAQAADTAETAAADASHAADTADAVAEDAGMATGATRAGTDAGDDTPPARAVSDGRRRPDAPFDAPPRPAEAATEVSER